MWQEHRASNYAAPAAPSPASKRITILKAVTVHETKTITTHALLAAGLTPSAETRAAWESRTSEVNDLRSQIGARQLESEILRDIISELDGAETAEARAAALAMLPANSPSAAGAWASDGRGSALHLNSYARGKLVRQPEIDRLTRELNGAANGLPRTPTEEAKGLGEAFALAEIAAGRPLLTRDEDPEPLGGESDGWHGPDIYEVFSEVYGRDYDHRNDDVDGPLIQLSAQAWESGYFSAAASAP